MSTCAKPPDSLEQSHDATIAAETTGLPTSASSEAQLIVTTNGVTPASPPGYDLLEEIGHGGMGVVYRARDTALNRDVAVKVLSDRYPADSPAVHRFLSEARITGQLQHPGIPAVHQVGTLADGRPFLAMKLIRGNTFGRILRQRSEPSAKRGRMLAIFEAVCQAVGYAHAHRVIHRDLKPDNVMVGAFGEVQVMDWGLAKVLGENAPATEEVLAANQTRAWTQVGPTPEIGSHTQAGSLIGTPAFIPPEQAVGEIERVDQRSDVFGLGALLAVILTGQPPYVGDTFDSLRVQAVRGKLENCFARLDASGAEPGLVALCKQCLAFDPGDRPADGGAVAAAVAELRAAADERARRAELERVQVQAEQTAAAARAVERRKRRRLVVGAAAVLAMAAFGALYAMLEVQRRANDALTAKNEELANANRRVEARFALAEDAIKTFHTGVSEDFMLKEKDLGPLRKKLLASAHKFYTRLEGELQGQSDPASRAALAKAYRALARVTRDADSAEVALTAFHQALALQRPLTVELGAEPDATADLIETLHEVVTINNLLHKTAEAEPTAREALSLSRGLNERHPRVERYQSNLADSLVSVSTFLPPAEKLESLQQAEEIRRRLVQANPKNLEYLKGLAESTGRLGSELRIQGRVADGEAAYQRAIALHEQLTQAEPTNVLYQNNVARWCVNLGLGLSNARTEETLAYFRKAQSIWEKALSDYPNSLFLQNNVAFIHDVIAKRLCVLDRPQEEAAAYERESAGYEKAARSDPSNPVYPHEVADCQEMLSLLYARAGRLSDALTSAQKAVAIREELARTHPDFQPNILIPCQLKLADLQKAGGYLAEANALYEKTLAFYQKQAAADGVQPSASALRGVGVALQRLGRTTEAVAHYRTALALIQDSKSPHWFELARTRALLAGIASEPSSGMTAEEGESQAMQAVQALRRHVAGRHATVQEAAAAEYVDVSFVDKNFQLDSLRPRADFQALMREMRAQGPAKQQ